MRILGGKPQAGGCLPGEEVTAMAAPLQEHVEVSDIFMLCVSSNEFCFEY